MKKKNRKNERKRIRREARKVLFARFGVADGIMCDYHSICDYIRRYSPETAQGTDGYDLIYKFVGQKRNETSKPRKIYPKQPRPSVALDSFLATYEWRRVRMVALKRYGARCQCCGATPADGATMNVDHIKPRRTHPELALDVDNLQILCNPCNHGKGNWDVTDWRPKLEIVA